MFHRAFRTTLIRRQIQFTKAQEQAIIRLSRARGESFAGTVRRMVVTSLREHGLHED